MKLEYRLCFCNVHTCTQSVIQSCASYRVWFLWAHWSDKWVSTLLLCPCFHTRTRSSAAKSCDLNRQEENLYVCRWTFYVVTPFYLLALNLFNYFLSKTIHLNCNFLTWCSNSISQRQWKQRIFFPFCFLTAHQATVLSLPCCSFCYSDLRTHWSH